MWITVGPEVTDTASDGIELKLFDGGLYAVMSTTLMTIQDAWYRFGKWLHMSRYNFGTHQWL